MGSSRLKGFLLAQHFAAILRTLGETKTAGPQQETYGLCYQERLPSHNKTL